MGLFLCSCSIFYGNKTYPPETRRKFHKAIVDNDIALVKSLLNSKISPNILVERKRPALVFAVMENRPEVVKLLLARGANPNLQDSHGYTPLLLTAGKGNLEIAEQLLSHGADPNIASNDGTTPLMEASRMGKKKMVMLLIKHGAEVRAETASDQTALIAAIRSGKSSPEIIKLLLSYGADINKTDKNNMTPVLWAAKLGKFDEFKLLAEKGANVKVVDEKGLNVLALAIISGNLKFVKYLIEKRKFLFREEALVYMEVAGRADLEDITRTTRKYMFGRHYSALMWAVKYNHYDIAEYLLKNGANPNYQNTNEQNPMSLASNQRMRRLLKKYGGKK